MSTRARQFALAFVLAGTGFVVAAALLTRWADSPALAFARVVAR